VAVQAVPERVQLHAFVAPDVQRQLREIAEANDRSLSAEIRRAIAEHVRREQERKHGGSVA
jgi:predicted transcriptional regulator